MPRFFVTPQALCGDAISLTGEDAAHAKVLRIAPGDRVTVCDGEGHDCICDVAAVSPGLVALTALERRPSRSEPSVFCSVYMALPKADKLEHVIQKATELGAAEIVTFPTSRCVARLDAKALPKKLERWQKIARAAAEQSGRGVIPQVLVLPDYAAALARAAQAEMPLFFYEKEQAASLRGCLASASSATVALMSGPEGGFSEAEAQAAVDAGLRSCSLGPRILRCETAPLCALSAVLYALGQL